MEKLFEEKERNMLEPTHQETEFEFFERDGSEEAEKRRQIINTWFASYPEEGRHELRRRIKVSFSTALYELFIYTLFIKQGFKLQIHPEVPGTTKRPDFLASKDGVEFYIEATEASEMTEDEKRTDNRMKTVLDAVNKIKTPKFMLCLHENSLKSSNQPNGRLIIKSLEEQINKYTAEEILANLEGDYDDRIKVKYEDNDVLLVFSLIPILDRYVGTDMRPIGMYANKDYVAPNDSISNSIVKKANRYGELDKPLILCVNTGSSLGFTTHSVWDILFGNLAITWSDNPANRDEKWLRQWQGIIGNPKYPKTKRVSGFLFTSLNSGTIVEPNHWFFNHPFALKPIDFNMFSLTYSYVKDFKIQTENKKTIIEILNSKE